MGDQLYVLKDGENIPVEPVGTLASDGWMPSTWVTWSTDDTTFSGAIGTVDKSDGEGILAGFLKTGPQHNQPVIEFSDMWTTEQRQRPGGDGKADWSGFDAGAAYLFDNAKLLQRQGSRLVTMQVPPTGYHKFYVFETKDKAERASPGSGAALVYAPNDKLFVSNQGLMTNEQEEVAHPWTGYVVGKVGNDFEGDFLIVVAAIA